VLEPGVDPGSGAGTVRCVDRFEGSPPRVDTGLGAPVQEPARHPHSAGGERSADRWPVGVEDAQESPHRQIRADSERVSNVLDLPQHTVNELGAVA
jgi:hypothetical protein